MKICGKKLIAGAAALAMTCSMVGVFADEAPAASGNAVTITKVEVLNSGDAAATVANTFDNPTSANTDISLTTEQLMRVTAVLKNGTGETAVPTAGEISFLSNVTNNGETSATVLDNSTIQYVDQQTFSGGTTDTVQITFRPRTTIGIGEQKNGTGTFIAKAGGTNVATAASFTYTVTEAKKIMTVTSSATEAINKNTSVTFTAKEGETLLSGVTITATCGTTVLTATTGENGTAEITFNATGTYTIKATMSGYNDAATANIVVREGMTPERQEAINDALNSTLNNLSPKENTDANTKEIELPESAKVGSDTENTDINYTMEASSSNVTLVNNKITVPTTVFAAKIVIEADIEGEKVQKTVYVKNTDGNIAFGNLELIASNGTEDAFADDTTLSAAKADATTSAKIEASRVEALNYALGRTTPEEAIKSAIDYDLSGEITLSEYRMFKLLLNGDSRFTAEALKNARQEWINKNKPAGN